MDRFITILFKNSSSNILHRTSKNSIPNKFLEYLSAIVMNPVNKQFWLNDPAELFRNFTIIPTENMPYPERLNTLTRLLLLVVLGLYLAGQKHYWLVLVVGLLLIIIFKGTRQQERFGDCGVSRLKA